MTGRLKSFQYLRSKKRRLSYQEKTCDNIHFFGRGRVHAIQNLTKRYKIRSMLPVVLLHIIDELTVAGRYFLGLCRSIGETINHLEVNA